MEQRILKVMSTDICYHYQFCNTIVISIESKNTTSNASVSGSSVLYDNRKKKVN